MDPLARIDVSKLNPEFYGMLLGLLGAAKAHGLRLLATYGFRSRDEQQKLYEKHLAGGPLAAPPGHSAHEFGCAVDFLALAKDGQVIQSSRAPEYTDLAELAPRYRCKTLQQYNDAGHVELENWHDVAMFADVVGGSSTCAC